MSEIETNNKPLHSAIALLLQSLHENETSLSKAFDTHGSDPASSKPGHECALAPPAVRNLLCSLLPNQEDAVNRLAAYCCASTENVTCAQLVRSLFVEHLVFLLRTRPGGLRALFKAYDGRSYGYITAEQLTHMLQHLCWMAPDDTMHLVAQVDPHSRGRISYRALYHSLFTSPNVMVQRKEWLSSRRHTIRSVVVITRHGARFPLKPFPKDGHWPKQDEFWERFGGRLTSVGSQQHVQLGERLRQKYLVREQLLDDQAPDLPIRVQAYASNQDRTLMSAQSLLLGMFPGACPSFRVDAEAKFAQHQRRSRERISTLVSVDHLLTGSSIPLHVASEAYSPLLHGFKANAAYDQLQDHVFDNARLFQDLAKDGKYIRLADKMWRMTGFEKLSPETPTAKRFKHYQTVRQQTHIERAHDMALLHNGAGETLDAEEELLLNEVADSVCRLRYCGEDVAMQRRLARLASGTLPATIVRSFVGVAAAREKAGTFTLYSAHDNTILAVLAHLGFKDFPIPCFAAFLAFELHERNEEFFVRILYNPDPETYGFPQDPECLQGLRKSCDYFALPGPGQVIRWSERELHDMALAEFEFLVMQDRRSFEDEHAWLAACSSNGFDLEVSTVLPEPHLPRLAAKLPLSRFDDQVGGHKETILSMGPAKLCKPLKDGEHAFYVLLFGAMETSESVAETYGPKALEACRLRAALDAAMHAQFSALRAWVPRFYGAVYVSPVDTAQAQYSERERSESPLRRRYSMRVPDSFRRNTADLQNGKLKEAQQVALASIQASSLSPIRPSSPVFSVSSDRLSASSMRSRTASMRSDVARPVAGWVEVQSWQQRGWTRCWLVLNEEGDHSRPGSTPRRPSSSGATALGSLDVRTDVAQIKGLESGRSSPVLEPEVHVVTKADVVVPLRFSSREDASRWAAALRRIREVEEATDRAVVSLATQALDESMIVLEEAKDLLARLGLGSDKTAAVQTQAKEATPTQQERVNGSVFVETPSSAGASPTFGGIYVVLENLVSSFNRPCVLDLKLGVRQHSDDATPEKRAKQVEKCAQTTSASLGVRCCGMRVYLDVNLPPVEIDKHFGRKLTKDTFGDECLRRFLTNSSGFRYEVADGMIRKLEMLEKALSSLSAFRFYSTSLLIVYSAEDPDHHVDNRVEMRLIDFAQTLTPASKPQSRGPDRGAIFGVRSLLRILREMVRA